MKKCNSHGIEWLTFPTLNCFSQLSHKVFLRGHNFDLGDQVQVNHLQSVLSLMGVNQGIKLKQSHSANVLTINTQHIGWTLYENYDGIITQEPGIALLIRHADCQAALFFDPRTQTIGNAHCGWRGHLKNIYQKMVESMIKTYGVNPQDLRVCLSPSLGPNQAEFKQYKQLFPRHFWTFQVQPGYFDFWSMGRDQLIQAGVLPQHIEIAKRCTYSDPTHYFSYRRDQTDARHGTVIALNPC